MIGPPLTIVIITASASTSAIGKGRKFDRYIFMRYVVHRCSS